MAEKRNRGGAGPVVAELIYMGVSIAASAWVMRWLISAIDPEKENKKRAQQLKKAVQARLGRKIDTNTYEDYVAMEVINPEHIDCSLDQIGGNERVKKDLINRVIKPLQHPHLYRSNLVRQVKGVLLYGPPGTGKTMLAKALAKESMVNFINVKPSMLQSKWFGDTQKLVQATFSLAAKLQPCIIFVDEVDSLLGSRRSHEHEATTSLKTEFMQLWDGMLTNKANNVMVLAATNRPYDLDEAILRRFGAQFQVPMPDRNARKQILQLILENHEREMPGSVDPALLQDTPSKGRLLSVLSQELDNFSGSDLYELCAEAASIPLYEESASLSEEDLHYLDRASRQVSMADFRKVLETFRPSGQHSQEYREEQANSGQVAPSQFLDALALLMNMATSNSARAPDNGGANGH
ncbi:g11911 [Coccomyxa viridis]|uniref:G11911 protein n=1 Tax=Coccomyxa viridis TaxID=1274662 RepID=A0ABP1G918_9CHLO